jgi:hypothetical protein
VRSDESKKKTEMEVGDVCLVGESKKKGKGYVGGGEKKGKKKKKVKRNEE